MGLYQLGEDVNGHPLTEDRFYIHNQTNDVIQLFRDAAGFRVEYGPGGKHANIFNLKEGKNYRPMAQEDFEREIGNSTKRKAWLERGLADVVKTEENNNLGKNFLELMEEGFYYCLLDSNINAIWYLSFSPDKSQIFAESSHQPPLTYLLLKDRSKFERDFLGFLKIDLSKILNLPNDVPMYQKAQDFIKLKLEQLT